MFGLSRTLFVWLLFLAGMTSSGLLSAATSILNSSGGSSTSNGLKVYIDDGTQIQVQRLNSTGQLYQPDRTPPNNRLDNGIYIRGNNTIYGPDHFAYGASSYTGVSVSTVTPATVSQGVAQTTTSTFTVPYNSLPSGPQVSIVWSYTYPFDFVTASVTITIPPTYPVSSSNPVRYYHVVDTYLGGSDCGCGVRYVDSNGKQVAGTYPLSGSCSSGSTSTNVSCPSSTTLPANLDVVESFRERNGSFTRYCVGNWQSFWSNSNSDACGIGKTNQLSNTVNTTLTDTGAAIEYDFTAAGVYKFSYDFVVGSTAVPNYDHLEIRHAGTSSQCPFDVQVMACLSSSVPCPDDQLVSSGALYGDLLPASSSSLTKTPNEQFNLGSNGSVATFTLQSNTATTLTFGANNLTKAPLNGVKCWNTATNSQSCSFVVTNTPCVNTFECMENTLTYNNLQTNSSARNPLYTKVFGTSFDVDVVALLSSGAQSSGYNSTTGLTVQLVDDSAGACGSTVVASKTVPFAISDSGRKKVTFTSSDVTRPHSSLRCKVTDVGLVKTGCSSDNFAIRPSSLTVVNATLAQSSPSPTSTPVLVAGIGAGTATSFSLTASTSELTYTGTPKIDNSKVAAHTGAPVAGQVSGSFNAAISGVSTGTSFYYSEVGHFKFLTQGVYDDTYTAVDIANGDCDNATAPFDSSGSGTPKKYGCRFGNTVDSSYFGRFIPSLFTVTPSTSTLACGSFVYYGQDALVSSTSSVITPFTVTAKNAANVVTQNYTGAYGKLVLSDYASSQYYFTSELSNGASLIPSVVSPNVTQQTNNSIPTWGNGTVDVKVKHKISRPASAINEQNITVYAQPKDADNVTTTSKVALTGTFPVRYGRVAITPAHGSELLPLSVPIEAQYYKSGAYLRNTLDSCSTFNLSTMAMKNYKGNLNACETILSGTASMSSGKMSLTLSAPKVGTDGKPNTGSVDLDLNYGAAGGDQTCVSIVQSNAADGDGSKTLWFGADPSARASFGIYKAPVIYMRENF